MRYESAEHGRLKSRSALRSRGRCTGQTRLAIELTILGGGAAAVAFAGRYDLGIVFSVLILTHYAASWSRIEWLVHA